MRATKAAFIRQQGFPVTHVHDDLYRALMFQPRAVGVLIVIGTVSQSAALFLGLSIVLLWGTIVPARNVFDAIYNRLLADRRGLALVPVAPPPRRFAMGMAGGLALVTGLSILADAGIAARVLEGMFIAAVTAVVFARVCTPANLYNAVRRRLSGKTHIMPHPIDLV